MMRAMTLEQYLTSQKLTATAFAKKINKAVSTVTRIKHREIMPDPETVVAIYVATHGFVEPNSYYDLPKITNKNKRR